MRCEQAGIAKEKLLLDPGFGFGKNLSQLPTVGQAWEFHHFGLPLLVGMSRKSMVGQLLNVGPSERLNGSLACHRHWAICLNRRWRAGGSASCVVHYPRLPRRGIDVKEWHQTAG